MIDQPNTTSDTGSLRNTDFVFAMLAIIQATLIFTIALIMIPLPTIADEFALSPPQILLLQVAYGLPFSGLLLFGGRLTDRSGARRMLIIGLTLFAAASITASFAADFSLLIAMRFVQGVGGAIIAPAALGVVRSLYPDMATFGRAMAIWGGVSVLGAILGFISSGMVASVVSWRWMFAVPVAVSVLGLATAIGLPSKRGQAAAQHRPGLDPLGALLATAGISLASYALIASNGVSWTSAGVLAPIATGLGSLVLFLIAERKVRDPLLPPAFLLDPVRVTGLMGMLLAAAGSLLIEFVLLIYLQEVRGWTSFETAASFIPFAVALIVTNFVTSPIVGRFGAKAAMVAGLSIGVLALAWLATIDAETAYLAVLLPSQVLLAIGMALIFAGAAVLSTSNVPERQMGLAGGVMNTAMELGPTVGFAILMAVAATRSDVVDGYAWAFGTAAAAYAIAAILVLTVTNRRTEGSG